MAVRQEAYNKQLEAWKKETAEKLKQLREIRAQKQREEQERRQREEEEHKLKEEEERIRDQKLQEGTVFNL